MFYLILLITQSLSQLQDFNSPEAWQKKPESLESNLFTHKLRELVEFTLQIWDSIKSMMTTVKNHLKE